MSLPGQEVLTDVLLQGALQYASERAACRCAVVPDANTIDRLDRDFEALWRASAERIDPREREMLRRSAEIAYHKCRLEKFRSTVQDLSYRAGSSGGRGNSYGERAALKDTLRGYLASHSDLFRRDRNLGREISELIGVSEDAGREAMFRAQQASIDIYYAMNGFFLSGFRDVCNVLVKLNSGERELLRTAYEERYGRNLDEVLRDKYRGAKLSRLLNFLNGRSIEAASDGIALALAWRVTWPFRSRFSEVESILKRFSASDCRSIEEDFNKRHSGCFRSESLREVIEKGFKQDDASYLLTLLGSDRAASYTLLIKRLLKGQLKKNSHPYRVYQMLEQLRPSELVQMRANFPSGDLRNEINEAMRESPAKKRALAILDGGEDRLSVSRVCCALAGYPGTWIGEEFVGRQAPERRRLIETYNRLSGRDFWRDLQDHLIGPRLKRFLGILKCFPDPLRIIPWLERDYTFMSAFLREGRLSLADFLESCMRGPGTDDNGLLYALRGITRADYRLAKREYRAKYGSSLTRRLVCETSGDVRHQILELIRGVPRRHESKVLALEREIAHEQSGILAGCFDWVTREGRMMKSDVARVREWYETRLRAGQPDAEALDRFETLIRFARQSCAAYREAKEREAQRASNILAASVAAGGGLSIIALHGNGMLVAGGALALSLAVRLKLKRALKGRGYGREEIVRDVFLAGIDGLCVYVGRLAGQFASWQLPRLFRTGTKLGLKKLIELSSSFQKERLCSPLWTAMKDACDSFQGSSPKASVPAEAEGASPDSLERGFGAARDQFMTQPLSKVETHRPHDPL